jgi:hypothetical protein
MILVGALAAALAAAPAPTVSEGPKAYVSGFCVPFVLSSGEPDRLRRLFTYWHAKSVSDSEAEAFRPSDADAPGQMTTFPEAEAPHAFLDRQRGTCSLVFDGAALRKIVLDDFQNAALPIGGYSGGGIEHWRHVTTKRVGPPEPIRYFVSSSDVIGAGICATAFEDLRRRDNSPVVMIRISPCRLGPTDVLEQ